MTYTVPAGRRLLVSADVQFQKAAGGDVATGVSLIIANTDNTELQRRISHCAAPGFSTVVANVYRTPAAGLYAQGPRTQAGFADRRGRG